jgi:hypothetical protein
LRNVPSPDLRDDHVAVAEKHLRLPGIADAAGGSGEQHVAGPQRHTPAELGDQPLDPERHLPG